MIDPDFSRELARLKRTQTFTAMMRAGIWFAFVDRCVAAERPERLGPADRDRLEAARREAAA